jgi:hypothetical protein
LHDGYDETTEANNTLHHQFVRDIPLVVIKFHESPVWRGAAIRYENVNASEFVEHGLDHTLYILPLREVALEGQYPAPSLLGQLLPRLLQNVSTASVYDSNRALRG